MKIRDFMISNINTCRCTDTLSAAAGRMWDGDFGFLPVLDENDRMVGIITDRDICMAGYTQGKALNDIPVTSAMSHVVTGCAPTDTAENALAQMRKLRIRRLPVVNADQKLVGVVSLNDIVRLAAATRAVNPQAVLGTMADICEPRHEPRVA